MRNFFRKLKGLSPLTITIGAIVLILIAYINQPGFLEIIELKTIDARFRWRGEVQPGPEVVLAVIDEKSIQEQGKWVWPRTKIANLITKCSDAGAAVVGMDIGFLEPDQHSAAMAVEEVEAALSALEMDDPRLVETLEQVKNRGDHDRILAAAIRNSTADVVLGFFFLMSGEGMGRLTEEEVEYHEKNSDGAKFNLVRWTPGSGADYNAIPVSAAFRPQSNIPVIANSTNYAGYFNMQADRDGTFRWMPMAIQWEDSLYAPLSLKTVQAYLDANIEMLVADWGVEDVKVGGYSIPVNEKGRLLVNYRGGRRTFTHVSVTDILKGRIAPNMLRDKIVLVGATAVGIYDLRVTPFQQEDYPGLEIHANVVDNILRRDFLRQPNWTQLIDILAILILGAVMGAVLPRGSVLVGISLLLFLFIGYYALAQYMFSSLGIVLNLVYPIALILLVYVSITVYKYVTEEKEKRWIKGAFSTYLSPTYVDQLIKSPDRLKLGGENREITAYFSDVQGFTSISQKLGATELVELLNEFLTEMTDIVLDLGGTVDKYEGDAIIAFWGAPLDMPDHAAKACEACVYMQKRLLELRRKFAGEGRPELRMRIGMNTGSAVVGNMGSKSRLDYTMMGDTVNIAARLEGVNKEYGTYTMISDSTYQQAREHIEARLLDAVVVVGRDEPVPVYEVLSMKGHLDPDVAKVVELYEQGLQLYRSRKWDHAISRFSAALAIREDDGPSGVMMERCRRYKENPPPDDWDGSYSMTSK
ncbi:MAG: CHASE2 domain-containing protein [Desulfatibacillaceae bacterium]